MSNRWPGIFALLGGLAALVLMSAGATTLYSSFFALFLEPVSKDLGWDLARFPQGLLAYSVSYAVAAPLAGVLSDRIGARLAVVPGIAFTTAGLCGISFMHGSLGELFLYSCFMGVGGALVSPPTLARSVAGYFQKRRGLAVGLIFGSGPMLAAGALSPVVSQVIAAFGWRIAYRGMAAVAAVASLVMALAFLKPAINKGVPESVSPEAPQGGADLRAALSGRTFWLILAITLEIDIVFGGLSGHIVAIAREAGQSASFGAAILSAIFLGGVVAPVVAGAASDWLDSAKALLPFLVMPLIGLALLMAKANGVFLMAGSGMIGLGFAAWAGQMPLLITRYFGLRATGAIIGIICAAGGVFLGLGPVVLGFLRSASGNYHNALVMCLVLQAVAVALAALLGPFTAKLPKSPSYDLLDIAPLPGGGHS